MSDNDDTDETQTNYNETCYNETLYPIVTTGNDSSNAPSGINETPQTQYRLDSGINETVTGEHPMTSTEAEQPVTTKATETGVAVHRKPRHPRVYDPARHCGAKSRSNNMLPCTLPKGWGTDHVGESRCKLHGGSSARPAGGRYSTVMRPALKASIERHDADPRPMDLIPEVSLLRALVEDYVSRYDVIRDALLAWHMAIQQGSATPVIPARLPDITEAGRLIERVARVADTVHRIATEGSISLDCFRRLMECMGSDVARLVSKLDMSEDVKTRLLDDIQKAWQDVRVDTNRRPA